MIFIPGTTNGDSEATTRVWIGGTTLDFVGMSVCAKTPETKVASSDERVVLTLLPIGSTPDSVTAGTRTFWRAALGELLDAGFFKVGQLGRKTYVPMFALMRFWFTCPTKAYDCTSVGVATLFAAFSSRLTQEMRDVTVSDRALSEEAFTAETVAPVYARPTCTFELATFANDPVGAAIMYNLRSASKTPVLLSRYGRL